MDRKPAALMMVSQSEPSYIGPEVSLVDRCRNVVVSNLERYPPEAFGILDEGEWNTIIKCRHERTKPQKGKGGLDGTGRMNPAVGDKFMLELESSIPEFAQSDLVDKLIWKDIVEHRFKVGGLSRPKGLLFPWPVLEDMAEQHGSTLLSLAKMNSIDQEARKRGMKAIKAICEMPMDVTLLKSSGVGKTVKKFLKACSTNECLQVFDEPLSPQDLRDTPRSKLEAVLQVWMQMAANSGVRMSTSTDTDLSVDDQCTKDLAKARKCNSWRELFAVLTAYDEKRKSNHGARMRERRQKLDSVRPKIVKVRHATKRHNDIINRQRSLDAASSKFQQIRMEANVTSTRRRPPVTPSAQSASGGGFGAAVAFATGRKSLKSKAQTARPTTVQLSGNKLMKVPNSKKAAANLQRMAKKGGFSMR